MSGISNNGGVGPCGACKFLRRKCVKGCIFAPYFDSEQGALHFAAVHKVFGASNASKLLLRIPANKRLDAVVSLCYEALSRVRDPVYGCVGHIFTLQQQVINLQTELAYVQARVSIMQRCLPPQYPQQLTNVVNPQCSSQETLMQLDQPNSQLVDQEEQTSMEFSAATSDYPLGEIEGIDEDDELEMLAREVVAKYLPSVKFR